MVFILHVCVKLSFNPFKRHFCDVLSTKMNLYEILSRKDAFCNVSNIKQLYFVSFLFNKYQFRKKNRIFAQ